MSLKNFFNPHSIAIVGVSANPLKVGHLVAKNMLDAHYPGKLYFIHPTEKEILGVKTYESLAAIGKPVDLVIFAVPSTVAIKLLAEVVANGCKNVIIYAAGFKENHTEDGDAREKELLSQIEKHKLTLLGPNCIGFINTEKHINATFLKSGAPRGNIGIISQSGALGSAIVDTLNARVNLGISYFISLGNKSAMDESDCLSFLADDPQTQVIGMYLEDVGDGAKFRKTLEKVAKKKPVIILKGGSTKEGSSAAMSHTGSMVGDDQVFEAVCSQSYAIRVHQYHEFYQLLKMYSYHKVPSSRHILVLSNAGGMGVLLADQLVEAGLSLVMISEKTKKKLYGAFDEYKKITVHNPIDLLGDASAFDYEKAVTMTIQEKSIGAVMILLTPQANTEIMQTAEVLVKVQKKLPQKTLYPVFMGESSVKEERMYFEKNKMTSFSQFDGVPLLFTRIIERSEYMHSGSNAVTILPAPHSRALHIQTILAENDGKKFLNQYDSLKVLEHAGLKIAKTYLATSETELEKIIQKEGYPLVAKIASDKITHKTEVKGVITGLNSWDELVTAYQHFQALSPTEEGCYVQKQYSGYELIVGGKRDHTFGTVVLLGLGGIYAELLHEVVQFVYPFSFAYFEYALKKTKLKKFIDGYRNMPPLRLEELYEAAVKLGDLMNQHTRIKEIDINPLMVTTEQMVVADGRIILDQPVSE